MHPQHGVRNNGGVDRDRAAQIVHLDVGDILHLPQLCQQCSNVGLGEGGPSRGRPTCAIQCGTHLDIRLWALQHQAAEPAIQQGPFHRFGGGRFRHSQRRHVAASRPCLHLCFRLRLQRSEAMSHLGGAVGVDVDQHLGHVRQLRHDRPPRPLGHLVRSSDGAGGVCDLGEREGGGVREPRAPGSALRASRTCTCMSTSMEDPMYRALTFCTRSTPGRSCTTS